ncbi:Ppx/GppA phosphatase family protein [Niabella drilacis]|uniref:Exopolyphosphatase / guanosine-5'-triphosphate,3'-diphosphate pyrophosphatase n=1 Tax=Niabella drilacis (strain DSM 25811 / CCM 8410 / CCUG 62505 / LMG 26954 / E90) TaxID=1285928 RepID=A0A1G6YAL8_NIADE|nr:exopolyphosphatase [Niabella drilacis]SDD87534.1 exopolyphosphatase / guanosine-5'-triphosphate,3'-diphosphate pyrophosphatase [Niabella drilacis]
MKLAAIDIGSNAARLLITDVRMIKKNKPDFIKSNLIRVPLRLGFDVFESGEISAGKTAHILSTMKAYRHLLDAYEVERVKACATAAMRDAKNGPQIIRQIKEATGLDIEIISGDREAALIYESHVAENLTRDGSYLYIDVGGGSTELTCFTNGAMTFKRSFNIGTIRLLKQQVTEAQWEEMKNDIRNHLKGIKKITGIGSGGNINKVFSLSKRKEGRPLSLELLRDYYKEFSSMALGERMSNYKLREDRADVIVPALLIYINVLKWVGAEEILVPKIGLADGLIHSLYDEVCKQQ